MLPLHLSTQRPRSRPCSTCLSGTSRCPSRSMNANKESRLEPLTTLVAKSDEWDRQGHEGAHVEASQTRLRTRTAAAIIATRVSEDPLEGRTASQIEPPITAKPKTKKATAAASQSGWSAVPKYAPKKPPHTISAPDRTPTTAMTTRTTIPNHRLDQVGHGSPLRLNAHPQSDSWAYYDEWLRRATRSTHRSLKTLGGDEVISGNAYTTSLSLDGGDPSRHSFGKLGTVGF